MYSVIVMAALSAGASAPDCHFFSMGCYGGGYGGGCYGSGYGGCYGGGYGGCYGGGHGGRYGGCYGGSGWGGCYGGHGYGGGTCHGGHAGHSSSFGCHGGTAGPVYGGAAPTFAPAGPAAAVVSGSLTPAGQGGEAVIVVEMPEGAKLRVGDYLTNSTGGKRVLRTPALQPGREFAYTLTATIEKDGQTFTDTRQVAVTAGREVMARFTEADFKAGAAAVAGP